MTTAAAYDFIFQVIVLIGIYTTTKLGLAKRVTPELEIMLGRQPITITQFIRDYRSFLFKSKKF